MKNSSIIFVFLLFIVAIVVAVVYLMPKSYNWHEDFVTHSYQPYGYGMTKEIIEESFEDKFIEIHQPDQIFELDTFSNSISFTLKENLESNPVGIKHLLDFVAKGNLAVVNFKSLYSPIFDSIFNRIYNEDSVFFKVRDSIYWANVDSLSEYSDYYTDSSYYSDNIVYPVVFDNNLLGKTKLDSVSILKNKQVYSFKKAFKDTFQTMPVQFFTAKSFNPEIRKILYRARGNMVNDNFITELHFKLGEGQIIFNSFTLPIANYSLLKQDGFEYLNSQLDLDTIEHVIWNDASFTFNYLDESSLNKQNSPLRYLLKQKAFKYAWYLLLFSTILFLIFNLKRKQRVMPLHLTKQNTTLEYINTLGLLYFNNKDYISIALKLRTYFYYFIKRHYQITGQLTDEKIKLLSKFSKISESELIQLRNKLDALDGLVSISDTYLIELYKALQKLTKTKDYHGKHR